VPVTPALGQLEDAFIEEAPDRVQTGDPHAFDMLIRVTSTRLYRMAVRLTGSFQDAEDVVQESYEKMVAAFRASEFISRSAMEAWLYRVVANGALKLLRRRIRSRALVEQAPLRGADPARAEHRAELAILASWLEELPDPQRVALVLKELEGLSTAEVASVLECSEGAVEQRLVRARATLRARYGDE
jgi:RNA polymerase sigma-70 factor (ECF subfamily)